VNHPVAVEGLARNRRSAYIHREGCSRITTGYVHWIWADQHPDEDWKTSAPWLKPCAVCKPPSPLNSDEVNHVS
jgi:hypothetical protein